MDKKLLLLVLIILIGTFATLPTRAQDNPLSGVAMSIPVNGNNIKNGDIICASKEGFVPCSGSYDSGMYGVINNSPIASIELPSNGVLVNSSGTVRVNVATSFGDIKKGSFVTSSTTPGVGQLAVHNGYVLGIAQEDYSNTDKTKVGQILVSISIHPTIGISDSQTDLIRTLKEGLLSAQISPLAALRYLTAAFMAITGFLLGFIYFGRIAKAGVEAIGRNPLSRKTIEFGLVLHILLTIVIVAAGVGIGYLILIL